MGSLPITNVEMTYQLQRQMYASFILRHANIVPSLRLNIALNRLVILIVMRLNSVLRFQIVNDAYEMMLKRLLYYTYHRTYPFTTFAFVLINQLVSLFKISCIDPPTLTNFLKQQLVVIHRAYQYVHLKWK